MAKMQKKIGLHLWFCECYLPKHGLKKNSQKSPNLKKNL